MLVVCLAYIYTEIIFKLAKFTLLMMTAAIKCVFNLR